MKAIIFNQTGLPEEVLMLGEIPIPEPVENEIRVRMLASPINPADLLFIDGKYRIKPAFPQVAGLEGAGIVDKCGQNATIAKGTMVSFRHKCTWAEYVVVPAEKATILPADFLIEKACQFSLNPVTALALLDEVSEIKSDEYLLLTAGNSAVSKMIIQMARLRQMNVITVSRSENDFAELKSIGAVVTLTDNPATIGESIQLATNGKGVKFVLDSVGGNLITEILKNMQPFGKLVLYGLMSSENVCFHNSTIVFKNLSAKGFGLDAWLNNLTVKKREEAFSSLISMLKDPGFQMPVAAKYPLEEFISAFQNMQTSKNGKILLYSKI